MNPHTNEKVVSEMIASNEKGEKDHSELIRSLDPKQRKSLELFREYDVVSPASKLVIYLAFSL